MHPYILGIYGEPNGTKDTRFGEERVSLCIIMIQKICVTTLV